MQGASSMMVRGGRRREVESDEDDENKKVYMTWQSVSHVFMTWHGTRMTSRLTREMRGTTHEAGSSGSRRDTAAHCGAAVVRRGGVCSRALRVATRRQKNSGFVRQEPQSPVSPSCSARRRRLARAAPALRAHDTSTLLRDSASCATGLQMLRAARRRCRCASCASYPPPAWRGASSCG